MAPDKPPFEARGHMDFVKVAVDPWRFDFATTGARRVVARQDDAPQLRSNPGLRELGAHGGWVWFAL